MKSIIYIVLFLNIIFSSIISFAEDLISGINPNEFNYLVRPQIAFTIMLIAIGWIIPLYLMTRLGGVHI